MSDQKIKFSQLAVDDTLINNASFLPYLDTTDTSQSLSGTVKRTTLSAIQQSVIALSATFAAPPIAPAKLLSIFKEVSSVATPNNTVHAYGFSALGPVATSVDLVIAPKLNGALISQIPDNAVTGGGKRGTRAIDFQRQRTVLTQVAGSNNSTILNGCANAIDTVSPYSTILNGTTNCITDSSCANIIASCGSITSSSGSTILGGTNATMLNGGNNVTIGGNFSTIIQGVGTAILAGCSAAICCARVTTIIGGCNNITTGTSIDNSGIYHSVESCLVGTVQSSSVLNSIYSCATDGSYSGVQNTLCSFVGQSILSQVRNSDYGCASNACKSSIDSSECTDITSGVMSTILASIGSSVRCCSVGTCHDFILGSSFSHIHGAIFSSILGSESSCVITTIPGMDKNIIIGGCGVTLNDSCRMLILNVNSAIYNTCCNQTIIGNVVLMPNMPATVSPQYGLYYDLGTCQVFYTP